MLLSSCENDLKKIQEIAAGDVSKPVQRTTNVELIFSDSARVKTRALAPLVLDYSFNQEDSQTPKVKPEKSYKDMPKGVTIYRIDSLKETAKIVSNTAKWRDAEGVFELHKNVVASNNEGTVYKSEELIWDQNKHIMYSTMPVQITTKDGNVINGTDFESDENMTHYKLKQTTGIFNVTENPAAQ
ncbi:hypothetical protein GCM10023149_36590 [Mucilaginibacter gynuensis]|uniref:LPS export ABC transporter protein LptC n=2 Tax=Mucilaginibacter gynuensis TaxID=1302236 RepID=A0ABP8GWI6_9SPHI